jgi:hypothetical protein
LTVVSLLAACGGLFYDGDGELSDSGPFTAHHRYFLDLGPIDLTRPGRREYRLSRLPNEQFTVGLYTSMTTTPSGDNLTDSKPLSATVRIELRQGNSQLFDIVDDLRNWTWSEARDSYTFLYHSPPTGTGRSVGWSDFSANRSSNYRLAIEIVAADQGAAQYIFHLVAVGGGWK